MRHLLTLDDLSLVEIEEILSVAADLKEKCEAGNRPQLLTGQVLGLLFSKPSLRTRVSFESGMTHLGGTSLYLGQEVGWGTRESVSDFARVISQYVDAIVCRTHAHHSIEELARHCDCHVINGLTDHAHPCQAMADVMTLRELKGARAEKLAFVGDANNVARSLANACSKLGISFAIAAPKQYQFPADLFSSIQADSGSSAQLLQSDDPRIVLQDASAVYTDVWSSMGFEDETEQRKHDFADYQVNRQMMSLAPKDAIFMHCLPAHRGDEVTDEVIDGPQSVVVQQAANRLHLQKGLLAWMMTPQLTNPPSVPTKESSE